VKLMNIPVFSEKVPEHKTKKLNVNLMLTYCKGRVNPFFEFDHKINV